MRFLVLLLAGVFIAAVSPVWAQSTITTYTPDLANGGNIVSSVSSSTDHTQTQVTQSINGQQVPLEQHQERVISQDPNGSVVESIVRHYDGTGQLASIERTVTESHKEAAGGSTVRATVYRSDVNGNEQPAERRTTETKVAGTTTSVNTVIDQPGPSGPFQTIEKRVDVTQGTEKKNSTTESVYRGDPENGFREAVRKVINRTQTKDQTVEDSTDYQPGSEAGGLQFMERRVSTVTSTPNGQATIVDVYAPSADGHVQAPGAPPQLKQQQIITNTKNPDGSVVQTFSIREPSVSDATHLGDPRVITQTVCTGNCGGGPAAGPATAASAPTTAAPAAAKP